MKKAIVPIIIVVALIIVFAMMNQPTEEEIARRGKQVQLVYVEWSSELASTNVVKAVIEQVMDYDCKITPVSASAMWKSVAQGTKDGKIDGMVAAWLPTTHGHYLDDVNDQVIDLGANLEGTRIGLVVPTYVEIASIADLQVPEYAENFNNEIIGIDPGAGIMSTTEKAIETYGLEDYKLVSGSGATMTGALKAAIQKDEWIVITGWTPHWKWSRWDLKYLQDPRGVYGEEEEIHTIIRKGMETDLPKVYTFLNNFHWTPAQMQEVMNMNQQGGDPYQNAVKWISQNKDIVRGWLKGTGFADDVDNLSPAVADANEAVEEM